MSIIGYYDGTAVRIGELLQMNQKVLVIPIENEFVISFIGRSLSKRDNRKKSYEI